MKLKEAYILSENLLLELKAEDYVRKVLTFGDTFGTLNDRIIATDKSSGSIRCGNYSIDLYSKDNTHLETYHKEIIEVAKKEKLNETEIKLLNRSFEDLSTKIKSIQDDQNFKANNEKAKQSNNNLNFAQKTMKRNNALKNKILNHGVRIYG